MINTNAADMKHKGEDLKDKVKKMDASIFAVQETHFQKKGMFKMDGFHVFEAIRQTKQKGGSMLGIHVDLEPVLVKEYSETFELLVVEISAGRRKLRVITGYGPQENWEDKEKLPFFHALEDEIVKSEFEGREVIIMMDANSKLGNKYIKEDPKPQSKNGKLLAKIVDQHALVVVNGLEGKYKGVITREKHTTEGVEKSVIDFVIISESLANMVEYLEIDDERKEVLTKLIKTNKGTERKQSDHNLMKTKLNITWNPKVSYQTETVFNFKNIESQRKFKEETSYTNELSSIIDQQKPINIVTKKLLRRLKGFIQKSFKKIKITNKPDEILENLYSKRRQLQNNENEDSKKELEKIESELAEKYSEKMYKTIKREIDGINCEEGGFNSGHLWTLKNKLIPKHNDTPAAMVDNEGKLLTDTKEILKEAENHYTKVFEKTNIKEGLEEVENEKKQLCEEHLKTASKNKTPKWTVMDVKNAIKNLKNGKSKDPYEYPNELFKEGVAGDDLILATTKLMNRIKEEQVFPECLKVANVTNIYKNKGSRSSYDSYRGVFRTCVFRNILDRLIYNDNYSKIDSSLTDCNVGCRRKRNIRDNLFVLHAIVNDVKQGKCEPVDAVVYDVTKCFDSLWLQECINDLHEAGVNDDKLPLLYKTNQSARIAIKTPNGTTNSISIQETVMQGTVWGGLMCTTTMDQLGKYVYKDGSLIYKYKGKVAVPPLEMVDDVVTLSKCGATSVTLNSTVNTFMEHKKLKLNPKKCAKMHIGKACLNCPKLKVHEEEMKSSSKEKYLGDFVSTSGSTKDTVEARIIRGNAISVEIRSILNEIPLGTRRTEIGLALREAWFINGCLFNSEVWSNLSAQNVQKLEIIDHKILRHILGAHSKVPTEFLHLETGTLNISSVISVRRMSYLQTILKRHESELIRRVYNEMKENRVKGDWYGLVSNDFSDIDEQIDEITIANLSETEFKRQIKEKVRKKALANFNEMKCNHSKIRNLNYESLVKPQAYITSMLLNNKQTSLLVNLRSRCERSFRKNFATLHAGDQNCVLCGSEPDTQEHALQCHKVKEHMNQEERNLMQIVKYEHMYGSTKEQANLSTVYLTILDIRERAQADQGIILDQTTSDTDLYN